MTTKQNLTTAQIAAEMTYLATFTREAALRHIALMGDYIGEASCERLAAFVNSERFNRPALYV